MTFRWYSRLATAAALVVAVGCAGSPAGGAPDVRDVRITGGGWNSGEGRASTTHDLGRDEARGGHTLSRHVGLSDGDLRARLAQERNIAAASAYVDRETAERTVYRALHAEARRVGEWAGRHGRRPNLALHVRGSGEHPIGRVVERGELTPRPCYDAVVVLKWDERHGDFFVLTSYPETRR